MFNNRRKSGISTVIFVVSTILLLLGDITIGLEVNEFFYVAVFSIIFALSKKENIIEMLCFFFPLSFHVSSVTYIWLIVLFILIVKDRFKLQVRRTIIIAFFSLLELVAHYLYGISDVNRMGGYLLCMALMFYLIYEEKATINYEKCLILYSYGVFALCAIYLENAISHAPSGWMSMLSTGNLRIGGTINSAITDMDIDLNANTLAYCSLTGTVISIVLLQVKTFDKRIKKILFIVQLVFVTAVGALTVSRSWLLVIVISLSFYCLVQKNTTKNFLKYMAIILVASLSIVLLFLQGDNMFINAFVSRLGNSDLRNAAGRVEIFNAYMDLFFSSNKYMIFGTGVTDYIKVTNMWQSIHMGFQQILICLGIPGGIIFLYFLIKPTFFAIKRKVPLEYWIVIISILLFTQTIQFLNPWLIMLPYVIGIYCLRYGLENRGL